MSRGHISTGVLGPGTVQLAVLYRPAGAGSVFPWYPDHGALAVAPVHVGNTAPVGLLLQPVAHQHPVSSPVACRRGGGGPE